MGRPEESGTVSELACRGPLPNERRQVLDARDGLIVSDKRYALLRKCARASRADGYGLVIEGLILAVGETAMQFSEASALHQEEVEFAQGSIDVRFQYDMKQRRRVASKKPRWVFLSPALQEHLEGMSGSGPIVFPTIRGDYCTPSSFHSHWDAVRVAAGMPSLTFSELRRRALHWMVSPRQEGGLGLDHETVALIAGYAGPPNISCGFVRARAARSL